MKCGNFNPQHYLEALMIEADGVNSGVKTVESYCHIANCESDRKMLARFIVDDDRMTAEELGFVYEGMLEIEELVNPHPDRVL